MKCVQITEYGDAGKLMYTEVPQPKPEPGQVLVRVLFTSVNPVDWKIRSGAAKDRMPVQFPFVPGRDLAGEVVEVGKEAAGFEPGQKVMGLVWRTYADYLVASPDELTVIPEGLDPEQAGVLPLVVTTGAQLVEHLNPKSGQTVLVTGALGSVGRTAVYVAKDYGARVIAGVRGNQKKEAEALGAAQVVAIDHDSEINDLTELDAIADTVDGDVIGKLLGKLKKGGVLGTVVGKPAAAEGMDIHVEAFMAQPDADRLQQLGRAVSKGEFTIPIAKKFRLSEAAEAHRFGEQGHASGKISLQP